MRHYSVDMERQVWASAVASGPHGARLSGTFKQSAEFAYQDDLAAALTAWCCEVPHGKAVQVDIRLTLG